MAIENIATGYKPQFALGALYHGFNAGSQDNASQLANLIQEQALQKSIETDPYDVLRSQYEGLLARDKMNSPTFMPQMLRGMEGEQISKEMQGQEAIRKNDIGSLLQPFLKQNMPLEQGIKKRQLSMQDENDQIDQLIDRGGMDQFGNQATPQQMQMWKGLRQQRIDRLATNPDILNKIQLENVKGQWDIDKANIMAGASRDAAASGGKAAWAQALPAVTQMIKSTQEILGKLAGNEMDDAISEKVRLSGKKPGTPEYAQAMKSEKDTLRTKLSADLAEQQQVYKSILSQGGFGGVPAQAPAPTTGPSYNYVPGQGLVPQ